MWHSDTTTYMMTKKSDKEKSKKPETGRRDDQ